MAPDGTLEMTGEYSGPLLRASWASVDTGDLAGTGSYVKVPDED
jgi:hypothetical protein